jgi:hypothetical protein
MSEVDCDECRDRFSQLNVFSPCALLNTFIHRKLYNKWHFLGFMKKRWMVMLPGTGRVFVMCVRARWNDTAFALALLLLFSVWVYFSRFCFSSHFTTTSRGASSRSYSIQEHCSTLLHFNFILPSHHHRTFQCSMSMSCCTFLSFSLTLLSYYPTNDNNNNKRDQQLWLHIKW